MDFKGFARSPLDIAREYERIDRTEDFLRTQEQAALNAEREFGGSATATTAIPVQPVSTQDRSKNVLRPETFADVVGQDHGRECTAAQPAPGPPPDGRSVRHRQDDARARRSA
jgi:hypothetical protein